jgi:hypothetical protein
MEWWEELIERARTRARSRVAAARTLHPDEDDVALGRRLIAAAAWRAGLAGAVTGTLALIAFPIGLPAGIATSLFFEAELIFELLELYQLPTAGDEGRLKLYALWAGAGFADAARSVGLRAGARALGQALRGSLPVRIIRRLNPALVRAILRKLGLGFLPKAARLWPLLGAPLAFAFDRAALRTLGEGALATLDDEARARRRKAKTRPVVATRSRKHARAKPT